MNILQNLQLVLFSVAGVALAYGLVIFFIPLIIKYSNKYNLMDIPNDRKKHSNPKSSLGGLGVFAAVIIIAVLIDFIYPGSNSTIMIISVGILVFTGFTDDIFELSAKRKLVIQLLAATLMVAAGVRIESFNGILGIYELSVPVQYAFSILLLVVVSNAFNLIDGIDGLLGSISLLNVLVLAPVFLYIGDYYNMILCLVMAGALLGFLKFNLYPSKIFMGDTGSLPIGFLFGVWFIMLFSHGIEVEGHEWVSSLALSIVFIPSLDLVRVFFLRILQKRSPFSADRNHLHHIILRYYSNHKKATMIIAFMHFIFLMTTLSIVPTLISLSVLFTVAFLLFIKIGMPFVVKQE